jgi:hypothetical protein
MELVEEIVVALEASSIHEPILARFLRPSRPTVPSARAMPPVDNYDPARWSALLDALHLPPSALGDGVASYVCACLASAVAAAQAAPAAAALAGALQRLVTVAAGVPGTAADAARLSDATRLELLIAAAASARTATASRQSGTCGGHMLQGESPGLQGIPSPGASLFPGELPATCGGARSASSPQGYTPDRSPEVRGVLSPADVPGARAPWLPVQLTSWGVATACMQLAARQLALVHLAVKQQAPDEEDEDAACGTNGHAEQLQREPSLARELGQLEGRQERPSAHAPPPRGSPLQGDQLLLETLDTAQHVLAEEGALRSRLESAAPGLAWCCAPAPPVDQAVDDLEALLQATLLAVLSVCPLCTSPLLPCFSGPRVTACEALFCAPQCMQGRTRAVLS